MSRSTNVYVGPYLYCKRKFENVTSTQRRADHYDTCSTANDYEFGNFVKFCPQCGSVVEDVSVESDGVRTFFGRIYDDEYKGNIIPVDRAALVKYFGVIDNYGIGDEEETHDFLTIENLGIYINSEDSGVTDHTQLNFKRLSYNPSTEMIELLQQYMEYESIEMKYGTLVSISY